MSRFIQAEYPSHHEGVERIARAGESLRQVRRAFEGGRGAATLLLAALVSALMVVANQVIDTWTEGRLLAAWIAMWAVAFAALALFAEPVARLAAALRVGLKAWAAARKEAAEDRKLWELARTDDRVMADLSCAMSREGLRGARSLNYL